MHFTSRTSASRLNAVEGRVRNIFVRWIRRDGFTRVAEFEFEQFLLGQQRRRALAAGRPPSRPEPRTQQASLPFRASDSPSVQYPAVETLPRVSAHAPPSLRVLPGRHLPCVVETRRFGRRLDNRSSFWAVRPLANRRWLHPLRSAEDLSESGSSGVQLSASRCVLVPHARATRRNSTISGIGPSASTTKVRCCDSVLADRYS